METRSSGTNRIAKTLPSQRRRSGLTLPELLAVILLAAVVLLIATLSVYRGKEAAEELACQDNMRAIHSAIQIYWTKNRDSVTNEHVYPVDQAAFELFLGDPAYFPEEPRCPLDDENSHHYLYAYDAVANPGPEGITITCPVADSGHGSH